MENLLIIAGLIVVYFLKDAFKASADNMTEEMLKDQAIEAPARVEELMEANKKLEEIETKHGKIVSAAEVLKKARGGK